MEVNPKIQMIDKMIAALEKLVGQFIEIRESISHDEIRGFDRHCTVVNYFRFVVTEVGWQMSGGHVYLHGENSQYGIQPGNIISVDLGQNGISITEKYESRTLRQSKISNCF